MPAPTISVHVGKSVNVGPVTAYSQFEGPDSPNNVVDEAVQLSAECPSMKARAGFLADRRTLFIDGLVVTTVPVSVIVRRSSTVSDSILVNVLPLDNDDPGADFPPAVRIANPDGTITVSAEYPTPATR